MDRILNIPSSRTYRASLEPSIILDPGLDHPQNAHCSPQQGGPRGNVRFTHCFVSDNEMCLTYVTIVRWAFLEAGVDGIMRNLRDGVDMMTVSCFGEFSLQNLY